MAQGLYLWSPQTEAEAEESFLRYLTGPNSMRLSIDDPDQESPLLGTLWKAREKTGKPRGGEGICLREEAGFWLQVQDEQIGGHW